MKRVSLAVAATFLLSIPAVADVSVGARAPDFALTNIFDSTCALSAPRAECIIVIITEKDIGDVSTAWRDSIRQHVANTVFATVLDMGEVSRFLRPIARSRIRDKGTKAFIDWDGEVSEAWRGGDRSQVYLYGVTPDNVVRFRIVGNPTSENVRRAVEELGTMRGATQ